MLIINLHFVFCFKYQQIRFKYIFFIYYILVLQRFLGGDTPANKVQEIKTDGHGSLTVLLRDENMILYGPTQTNNDKKSIYEIVLHRPYNEQANIYGYR